MPRIAYRDINFQPKSLAVIEHANQIAESYRRQGYSLTLRQLYYRFVAADLIANRQSEYKRLGSIINDARYAGLFDWALLEDRTRNVQGGDGSMTDPAETIEPYYFSTALWEGQTQRIEVWVEKDALVDVIGQAARRVRTPYFSCRGYTSASELWAAAQRIEGYLDEEDVTSVTVLHLGDHDPSGIDMTRDITDRLSEFLDGDGYDSFDLKVRRIALNMDQIRTYDPPPNPAKTTDSRYIGYRRIHGDESWELDALEPSVLDALITTNIRQVIEPGPWNAALKRQQAGRDTLTSIKEHYSDVIQYLRDEGKLVENDPEDES